MNINMDRWSSKSDIQSFDTIETFTELLHTLFWQMQENAWCLEKQMKGYISIEHVMKDLLVTYNFIIKKNVDISAELQIDFKTYVHKIITLIRNTTHVKKKTQYKNKV